MPTTLGIRRRRRLNIRGIGMPGNNDVILEAARKLQVEVEAPVLGGIAVFLHGYQRSTVDLDFYTPDRLITDLQLRAAGARWDATRREHLFGAVRIHTVTPEDAGHVVRTVSTIDGVRVVSLKDLITIKLKTGLRHVHRGKDIIDVQELISLVPLEKSFAAKLPKDLRADFKRLVDVVNAGKKSREGKPPF